MCTNPGIAERNSAAKGAGKGRILWLDLAKGLAMAMVLVGHSMRDEMRLSSPVLDLSYRLVYIIHMTWFFWMSGYTFSLSRNRGTSPLRAASRRLKKQFPLWLGYTLLIWATFRLALFLPRVSDALQEAGYIPLSLDTYLVLAFQANNPWAYHLWFLLVLMLITLILGLADAAAGGKHVKAVCWFLFALGVAGLAVRDQLLLGEWWRLYDYLTLYLPVVCLGVLMTDWQVSRRICLLWGAAGIAYIVIRAVFFSGFSGNSVRTEVPAARFLIYLLADLLLPGVFLLLKSLLSAGTILRTAPGRRFLTFLGRESLLIYLLHQPLCCAFLGLILYNRLHLPALAVMTACLFASLAVGFAAVWLRDRFWARSRSAK